VSGKDIENFGNQINKSLARVEKLWEYIRKTYNDKLISEALATYAAYLYFVNNDVD